MTACRGERLHRRDRGLWADGSHRWVETLAFHCDVCRHDKPSELRAEKGRHETQCEALRVLAGASGSTGQTGASGQTGLTGGFKLSLAIRMYAGVASYHSFAQRREGM